MQPVNANCCHCCYDLSGRKYSMCRIKKWDWMCVREESGLESLKHGPGRIGDDDESGDCFKLNQAFYFKLI